jgi:DNA-binding transcriptional regulator YiaG
MSSNPPLTPLAALRELYDQFLMQHSCYACIEGDGDTAPLTFWEARDMAQATIAHYTRTGWTGEDVKLRRHAAGLTQQQLADALDTHVNVLRLWEQGQRNPDRKSQAKLQAFFGEENDR